MSLTNNCTTRSCANFSWTNKIQSIKFLISLSMYFSLSFSLSLSLYIYIYIYIFIYLYIIYTLDRCQLWHNIFYGCLIDCHSLIGGPYRFCEKSSYIIFIAHNVMSHDMWYLPRWHNNSGQIQEKCIFNKNYLYHDLEGKLDIKSLK